VIFWFLPYKDEPVVAKFSNDQKSFKHWAKWKSLLSYSFFPQYIECRGKICVSLNLQNRSCCPLFLLQSSTGLAGYVCFYLDNIYCGLYMCAVKSTSLQFHWCNIHNIKIMFSWDVSFNIFYLNDQYGQFDHNLKQYLRKNSQLFLRAYR
jgi:hypothetical protein